MRKTGDKTRFYVYVAEGSEVGPLSFVEIQRYDAEAWVRVEEEVPYWPRRRWCKDGSLSTTAREHYQAWVWLLAFAPALAWFLMPELLRAEWGVAWLIALGVACGGMMMSGRDNPRFPKE